MPKIWNSKKCTSNLIKKIESELFTLKYMFIVINICVVSVFLLCIRSCVSGLVFSSEI